MRRLLPSHLTVSSAERLAHVRLKHARFVARPASRSLLGISHRLGITLIGVAFVAMIAPATSQAAATRAEYVAQADPICAAANGDIARLNRRFHRLHKKGRYRAAGAMLGKTGPRLSASVDQVRAIPPPPGDEQTVASWLAFIDGVAADNRKMGRAESHERFGTVAKLQRRNDRLHTHAHALVADFGFQDCA
jgi:hypothetical protein